MCCLFGMLDYSGHFTGRQRMAVLSILDVECEASGTDATGIARLPETKIQTDSYVAVQLIEKKKSLDFDSL